MSSEPSSDVGSTARPTGSHWRRAAAMARKEMITLSSYRFDLILRMVEIWYFAISFYFIDQFVGDVDLLSDLDGGYFEFVLVGSIVTSFARVGLSSFPALISEEQDDGTLEMTLVTPTPSWILLVGSFFVPVIFLIIETTVLVGIGLGIFGSGVPVAGLVRSVPLLILTSLSFVPLGVLGAAFIVLAKRGDPFTALGSRLAILLSGALYPLAVLPGWLQAAAAVVPSTYGVRGVRDLVQGAAPFSQVADELLVLGVFVAIALPLTLMTFDKALAVARRSGNLGTY